MRLPDLVQSYVTRSTSAGEPGAEVVRVRQEGEMWKKPGSRALRFTAVEELSVQHVAFSWNARFALVGPLAMTVVDELSDGRGRLRVSLAGIPLQTQTGPETNVGQAMRYLAELVWAPPAMEENRELDWKAVDGRTVEVGCDVGDDVASVRWELDAAGDVVRVTGVRPRPVGRTFVATPWGGDFGDYRDFGGVRAPSFGQAWWDLAEGRFVYWRGAVTALELITSS